MPLDKHRIKTIRIKETIKETIMVESLSQVQLVESFHLKCLEATVKTPSKLHLDKEMEIATIIMAAASMCAGFDGVESDVLAMLDSSYNKINDHVGIKMNAIVVMVDAQIFVIIQRDPSPVDATMEDNSLQMARHVAAITRTVIPTMEDAHRFANKHLMESSVRVSEDLL